MRNTLLIVLCGALSCAAQAQQGWITSCQYSHSLQDDPIVFFKQPGVSHLHDFAGSVGTRHDSNADQMRAAGTTCRTPGDASGYWTPALYIHGAQKLRVLPQATSKHALFYYRKKGAGNGKLVEPFPDNFRMVLGNGHARTVAENPLLGSQIEWKCGPGSNPTGPTPPAQCDSGVMVLSFTFPNCSDGRLDSADHISHVRYPVGGSCPSSHPTVLPRVQSFWRYLVGTQPIGEVTLASGPAASAHSDFWNAWDRAKLSALVARCMNVGGGMNCGTNPTP